MEDLEQAVQHHIAGRLAEAEAIYRRVLAQGPENPEIHHNLGYLLAQKGQVEEAIGHYRIAVALDPAYASAHTNLGALLMQQGRLLGTTGTPGAIDHLQLAIAADPAYFMAHNNLGAAYKRLGRFGEAIASCERALDLKPDYALAHNNLGAIYSLQGRLNEAVRHLRRAIALDPRYAEAHCNLGGPLTTLGCLDEALERYRVALRLKPDLWAAHTGLLLALHYHESVGAAQIFAAHKAFGERVEARFPPARPHDNDRRPDRRLRVGYVSPDFRTHPVGTFMEPLLRAHDRRHFEVLCYASVARPDEVTARLRGLADRWLDVAEMNDEAVAERVRGDGVDILVDLAGHTADNRLLVFARKPAPVQVTYLGYPDTTGLAAMDYRITDAWADPEGWTEALHTEKLVRLPHGFLCYQPPADLDAGGDGVLPVATLPARQSGKPGQVTFGSFNVLAKMTPSHVALWAFILKAVPGSRLLLKSAVLDDEGVRARLLGAILGHGVPGSQVVLLGRIPDPRAHLLLYNQVDIALDTYPYHGTTTTCEALWMGVPVLTLAGRTHARRVGVSLLSRVGLQELITDSPQSYADAAVALAGDLDRLQRLRTGLRERVRASTLVDAALVTRSLEEAYRKMWQSYCLEHPLT